MRQKDDEICALRAGAERAEREFAAVIEQTQMDLDDDDDNMRMQIERLQRETVEGLNAQLHVYMRCAPSLFGVL